MGDIGQGVVGLGLIFALGWLYIRWDEHRRRERERRCAEIHQRIKEHPEETEELLAELDRILGKRKG